MERIIAVLCVQKTTIYRGMPGVEVFDKARDARSWLGGSPAVFHPPCRAWSNKCAHQAKPEPGEKELGLYCAEQLKKWGGILEQPAHSRLFKAAGLPLPNEAGTAQLWTAVVLQEWWGYPTEKRTWLCFSRIPKKAVQIPIRLQLQNRGDRRRWQIMSKAQRSRTPKEFAEWLVATARKAL